MSIALREHIENVVQLTDEEFDWVLSHFKRKKFKKHQVLIQEGNYVRDDYFVESGLLKAYRITSDGKEHILQFALENGWITDPEAFNNGSRSTLYVACLEDSEVLSISMENREKICGRLQKMAYFFLKTTTACYIILQNRISCFLSSKAGERYHHLVSQYPGLTQRIPKTMIASYLGVTRETLSRLDTGK
jgi:CRP-like cAMP-binding protein